LESHRGTCLRIELPQLNENDGVAGS